jgi:hypothetical protein
MTAIAASIAGPAAIPPARLACKRRANCLKPKQIAARPAVTCRRFFDLRHAPNYLKVKTTGPAGVIAS